jgi:lactococcin 972 family bacteriocin
MKKTLTTPASAAAVLALAGALLVPTNAHASESASASDLASAPTVVADVGETSAGGGVLLPTGGVAPNYTSHPEGGTWIHGTDNGVYSNYHHPTKRHGSTAMNGRGLSHKVTNISGGAWSKASIAKTWAGNTAYWHLN